MRQLLTPVELGASSLKYPGATPSKPEQAAVIASISVASAWV
jgi:hypothetical protein